MTDARIARLTELARRVYGVSAYAWYDDDRASVAGVHTPNHDSVVEVSHPRALDALEAALLVLGSAYPDAVRLAMRDLAERGKLSTGKVTLRAEVGEDPPAWVEQLDEDEDAEVFHVAMKTMRAQNERNAYAILDHYTRSLRRRIYCRAKGEP